MSVKSIPNRWTIAPMDRVAARELAEALDVPVIIGHLLHIRGIRTPEEGDKFLYPRLSHLSDPFLLTDMDRAVERIARARDKDESILVFGDYDVDGISATSILIHGLRRYGIARCSYGMPHRIQDGYGLNPERVRAAKAEGVDLIITVDNGIAAHDAAQEAQAQGIDLIITDHHTLDGDLPPAYAVLNPKREEESYAGAGLCGAGVAFKLAMALNGTPNDLDIAALGTVADVVPLQGENRCIVTLGLQHMAKHQRMGLSKLAAVSRLELNNISSQNIGFQLGPRLNAAGRLDDGTLALRLLLDDCPQETAAIARSLDEANEERRSIEREIMEQIVEELDAFIRPEQRGIVVARRGWHPGVIGIVASRLQIRYGRPVVIIAIAEDGVGRGSARAGSDFDMMASFSNCREHLVKFGGHRAAAGMTIEEEHVEGFRADFERDALRQLGEGELSRQLDIDVLASFNEIDSTLLKALERMEPVGHCNPAPVFSSFGAEIVPGSIKVLKDQHLKASFRQGEHVLSGIGFGMAERFYQEPISGSVDLAYTPQFNEWRGETTIQLLLKDIRPATQD